MNTETITPEFQAQLFRLISDGIKTAKTERTIDANALLNEAKAAEVLGLAKGTLNIWRHEGKGPRYVKLGSAIRYKYSDLLDYINQRSIKGGVR